MLNEDSIVNGEYEFRNRKSIKIVMPKGSKDKDILPAAWNFVDDCNADRIFKQKEK